MRFSLIQVYNEKEGYIDGMWIQDFTGTLDAAIKKSNETEKANSNRIQIAVVKRVEGSTPDYDLIKNLKRLG